MPLTSHSAQLRYCWRISSCRRNCGRGQQSGNKVFVCVACRVLRVALSAGFLLGAGALRSPGVVHLRRTAPRPFSTCTSVGDGRRWQCCQCGEVAVHAASVRACASPPNTCIPSFASFVGEGATSTNIHGAPLTHYHLLRMLACTHVCCTARTFVVPIQSSRYQALLQMLDRNCASMMKYEYNSTN